MRIVLVMIVAVAAGGLAMVAAVEVAGGAVGEAAGDPPALAGQSPSLDRRQLEKIDAAVQAAIARREVPGAVVAVVHRDQVVLRKAYGQRAVTPQPEAMTEDTIFDLASLTKPVATATAVLLLEEQGKWRLEDPAARYWPAFAAHGKETVTLAQLLLHTSGLIADNPLADYGDGRAAVLRRIAELPLLDPPGTRFRYSDVGYIVLGELVERVSDEPLDVFVRRHIFEPLGMSDTSFGVPEAKRRRTAPTARRGEEMLRGVVHDPRAARLGGVAGHAGLFSSADDLARYCRMLLNAGELDGRRILKPETVRRFITPQLVPSSEKTGTVKGMGPPGRLLRTYGWDVDTAYSTPRGQWFPRTESFGHTGFTGTSIWIDPRTQTAVIILTSRLHPNEKGNATPLRREIGTIVARAVGYGPRP